ncbi:hypothetical protein GUITHDRAFT_134947 [Guillardia theta CCMP2712]|uniref:Methyltransferase type 11 domain-containing protein n=1 Tax=Guillardia theta (strain CCMP2712) TaxID=905079 RepID=L1JQK9_GUITC|nr:hypothetical protein GUITHDRAFT_134947 [Guillardia theta CCMP2712]EKX50841.1 hypothetical protein GUITHDRAFT_134947 [Guillardia theta CCMP2712]|eukprot:XP_005837821.1 hypothetical protein GUITHDRAFT_134947 [Guillardia theta CCMP2712]
MHRSLNVGRDEEACLARSKFYFHKCSNDADHPMLATFMPTASSRFWPPQGRRNAEVVVEWHGWEFNRVMRRNDFCSLQEEVDALRDIGYCLNQDAIYKWAAILKTVRVLQEEHQTSSSMGLPPTFSSIDVGGGSSPLQFFMSQKGSVTNIDINFLSSWFPIDGEGIYARADKSKLVFNRSNIHKIEGELLPELMRVPDGSIDLVYDACSLIHMWRHFARPEQGLERAVQEIHRILRPGGFFVVVSDVAHPDAQEVREFQHADSLASILYQAGVSMAQGKMQPEHTAEANMSSHALDARNLYTCEALPEVATCMYESKLKGIRESFSLWSPTSS